MKHSVPLHVAQAPGGCVGGSDSISAAQEAPAAGGSAAQEALSAQLEAQREAAQQAEVKLARQAAAWGDATEICAGDVRETRRRCAGDAHARMHMHTCVGTHARTCMYIHIHKPTYTDARRHKHASRLIHIDDAHTFAHTLVRTCTYTHIYVRTPTFSRAYLDA